MKIPILYDAGADNWTAEDITSVLESCEAVARVLEDAGHTCDMVPVTHDPRWTAALQDADVVFNLCEGVEGLSHLEFRVAAVVEAWGLPMTGTSAWTMVICHRKPLLNAFLDAAGLPIPQWHEIPDTSALPTDVPLPAIVKPAAEDASAGIDQRSVVRTMDELESRVETALRTFDRVLVQQYIAGREFNVGFVGDQTLPISEIDFTDMPDDAWPIVSFAAKWKPGCPEYRGTQPVCPADVDDELARRLVSVSKKAWQAVEGRGYGRVDLRVDAEGHPWVLEVNPCPDASPDAGLTNMARAHGWSYDELVLEILDAAIATRAVLASSEAR